MQDHCQQCDVPRQRYPLVALVLPVIGGIALDQYADMELRIWLVLALAAGLVAWSAAKAMIGSVFWRRAATLMLLIGTFALAGSWHHIRWNLFASDEIGLRALPEFQPTCLQAVALEAPLLLFNEGNDPLSTLPQEQSAIFSVRVLAIRAGSTWQTASGFVEVRVAGHVFGIEPGDTLQIFGKLRRPLGSMNPGDFSDFEYQRSRRRLSRLSVNYPAAIEVLDKASGWNPRWWIARLRQQGNELLQEYLPPRNADLAAALLLGDKQRIAKDRADAFMRTGTVHLLAISGLHVGVLVFGFYLIARVLLIPPRAALVCVLVIATTYALMSGFRAPVVRATILVYVFCLGSILRRQSFGFNSLAAAALIVLVMNPRELFHAGAQLSFVAVAAMIWYLPLLTQQRPKTPVVKLVIRRRSYVEVLLRIVGGQFLKAGLASVVIWFVALPLVMNQFHLVSPSALVLNLYLWIPMAMSLFCGFGILLVGGFCSPLAQVLAWVCNAALSWMEGSVQFAEPLWGSYFWVAGPATTVVVIFYAILVVGVLWAGSHRWWPVWTSLAFSLVFVNCWTADLRPLDSRPDELTCTFLSVGHGVCAILEFSTGEVWMYDAGSLGSAGSSTSRISEFLWSRGITQLDLLLLSHADVDHFNAVPGIVERFHVQRAVVSPAMFALEQESVSLLVSALQAARIPIQVVNAGTALHNRNGIRADVLHPRSRLAVESDNANSLVVSVSCAGRTILLTGDLADSGLTDLLSQSPVDCDVVLAPHHGSVRSQPATFCAWCSPEWVVVSSSLSDIHDEGPREYASVGCQVMHTAAAGAVRVQLSAAGTQVTSFCSLKVAESLSLVP